MLPVGLETSSTLAARIAAITSAQNIAARMSVVFRFLFSAQNCPWKNLFSIFTSEEQF